MLSRSSNLVFLIIFLLTALPLNGDWNEPDDWLEIAAEHKQEILDAIEKSKEFSEEQLAVVKDCLNESNLSDIVNCFSDGGVDQISTILVIIRDELSNIRERICGEGDLGNRDQCDQLGNKLMKMKDQLQHTWSNALEKGRQYLASHNRLFFMKRKICSRINEAGCYKWLNDRLDIKCSPQKIITAKELEQCRLEVVDDVWTRLQ